MNVEKLTNEVIAWIQDWFNNKSGNAKGVILGISGGKDSSIVAALCAKALGKDKVYGVLMPNGDQRDIDDAIEICKFLGIRYRIVNIASIVEALNNSIRFSPAYYENEEMDKFFPLSAHTQTNIPPRVRMTILYAIGQELGYRVVGTGNFSERFIGYFTKWGDGACDFNPIGWLNTEEMIAIGNYLNLPGHLVNKEPTDGLCGKTDEENLGYSYEDVNTFSIYKTCGDEEIDKKIEKAHLYSQHKLNSIPMFIPFPDINS